MVGFLLIQIFLPLRIAFLQSIGTWMVCVSIFLMVFIDLLSKKKANIYLIYCFVLAVLSLLLLLLSDEIRRRSIVSLISFLELPFLFSLDIKLNHKTKRYIYIIYTILALYYIVLAYSPLAYTYHTKYGYRIISDLTLGYNNPNETVIYLSICNGIIFSYVHVVDKIWKKAFLISINTCLSLMIFLTSSRTGILSLLLVVGMYFLYCRKNKEIPFRIVAFFMLLPVVFIFITLYARKVLNDTLFLGETFETGRLDIYEMVFKNISIKSILFGNYVYEFQNLHNGIVAIFATIGILGCLVFFAIFYNKVLYSYNNINDNKAQKVAFLAILGVVLFNTTSEAALITAGGAFAVQVITLFWICDEK